MVRCIVSHNDEPIKTYELGDEVITIGRLPENTISIANMGVSRRHARIERQSDGSYAVADLNSLNGTFVNNTKVKKAAVRDGDLISVGKFVVSFHVLQLEESPSPPPTPAPSQPEEAHEDHRDTLPPEVDLPSAGETGGNGAVLIETNKHVVYKIEKPTMSIGNSEDDDIFVTGFLIGDGHVVVERKDDDVWIGAQKMMGRFKVNGKKVNSHRLQHKDRIEIGNSTFRFMRNG